MKNVPFFNIVAATNENTVVTEYEPVKSRSDSYQSEAELEKEFIRLLCEQGYTYLPIHTEKNLIVNLRERLEELNNYKFSDSEWDRFFNEAIANPNDKIEDKTRKIQEDFVQVLKRDDALTKNILLIDKKNIHNNRLQVINQYVIGSEQGANLEKFPINTDHAVQEYHDKIAERLELRREIRDLTHNPRMYVHKVVCQQITGSMSLLPDTFFPI